MAAVNADRVRPFPFKFEKNNPRHLPQMNDEQIAYIEAVLKTLAKGRYPRPDTIPTALNAYNCMRPTQPWAYFHPITTLDLRKDGSWKEYPAIDLPENILADLKKPWDSIRFGKDYKPPLPCYQKQCGQPAPIPNPSNQDQNQNQNQNQNSSLRQGARYRFLCFIHVHTLSLRPGSRRAIYTISIWDREWEELTWHDTYWEGRATRRINARLFWRRAAASFGFPFLHLHLQHNNLQGNNNNNNRGEEDNPIAAFEKRIRFRTVYHAASRLGDALREYPNPRHTLWAVMGVAVHHMNRGGVDPHVGVVPDRLEFFGGVERDLLPRLWAHLFCLCLVVKGGYVRRGKEKGGRKGGGGGSESGGGGDEDEDEDEDGEAEDGEDGEEAREKQRREELVKYVGQFWILGRLEWMRTRTRKHLEGRLSREDKGWVFEALRLPEVEIPVRRIAVRRNDDKGKKKMGR